MAFSLRSPAFADGEPIPARHSAEAENASPPLAWSDPPPGTASFILIVEDPDAPNGTYRHWGIANIGPDVRALPEGVPRTAFLQVFNDDGEQGYDGPYPPRGHGIHHYHFRLAALDTPALEVADTAGVEGLWKKARGHILAEARLTGTYERNR